MWARPQSHQARQPLSRSRPKSATAALRPMVARLPGGGSGTARGALRPRARAGSPWRRTGRPAWRPARCRAAAWPGRVGRERGVADDEDLGVARQRRSAADLDAAGAVAARRRASCAAGEAATPAAHSTVRASQALLAHRDAVGVAGGDQVSRRTSTPRRSSARLRDGREVLGEGRAAGAARPRPGAPGRARGSMWRKSAAMRLARELGDRAGELDPGRAAADDDEGQQRCALGRVGRRSRPARRPSRMRRRMSVASSIFLRPGANGSHSSWPK